MEDFFEPRILEALSKREQYTKEAREHNLSRQIALNQKTIREDKPENVSAPACCEQGLRC
jgi:hypothetical protein